MHPQCSPYRVLVLHLKANGRVDMIPTLKATNSVTTHTYHLSLLVPTGCKVINHLWWPPPHLSPFPAVGSSCSPTQQCPCCLPAVRISGSTHGSTGPPPYNGEQSKHYCDARLQWNQALTLGYLVSFSLVCVLYVLYGLVKPFFFFFSECAIPVLISMSLYAELLSPGARDRAMAGSVSSNYLLSLHYNCLLEPRGCQRHAGTL